MLKSVKTLNTVKYLVFFVFFALFDVTKETLYRLNYYFNKIISFN
jgi:hypothetical protein